MSDHPRDPVTRRGALQCMAWAGTGLLWGLRAGVPVSLGTTQALAGTAGSTAAASLTFLQISDSHIGFNKPPNPDARVTLREAVAQIRTLPHAPAFIVHTGDVSHLSRDEEFDDADQILKEARLPLFFIPGEHDMLDDGQGRAWLARYGRDTHGAGWYSFDQGGVHFVALVNVANLTAGGMGSLGSEQLAWLAQDLAAVRSSTPLVVLAHIPLWAIYPEWGWGTDDAAAALSLTRRFGSVTVLNGHIHQVMQKIEGHVAFHTARSTAFPQPAPGTAPAPGPMKVPAEQLHSLLGIRTVSFVRGKGALAVVDSPLADSSGASAAAAGGAGAVAMLGSGAVAAGGADSQTGAAPSATVRIDNFTFGPALLTVAPGSTVTWVNEDDIPHSVVAEDGAFKSKVLDSQERFSFTFTAAGEFRYFCSLHPHMTGKVIVRTG
jgi:3',5'-cyclic-AMP phosphodiesterase